MKITIISVSEPTQQAGRTPYNLITVTYENEVGKVEQKRLVSFNFVDVYEAVKTKQRGDQFEVTREKNAKGFWEWTAVSDLGKTTVSQEKPSAASSPISSPTAGYTKPVSNYETREERAWRQVLIVRQSSVSAAVNALKTEKSGPLPVNVILAAATQIEEWVNRQPTAMEAIAAMPDDVPQ